MEKMHHNIEYPPRTFWNNDFYGGIESTSKCQGSSFFFFSGVVQDTLIPIFLISNRCGNRGIGWPVQ